ncbi:MAG: hypothetical protein Q8M03_05050 [Legionella sp.]|nr:hypothetical protein [Legionella sp.]
MPRPTIKDIIVVAELTKYKKDGALQTRYPIGEAPMGGETVKRMSAAERAGMQKRLFYTINNLIETAAATHLADCKLPDTDEVNQDFITRLSTNEFFFYTQEPLTLQEFEGLQNKIARIVDTLPAGIHLILGSFAVKTADNRVMNVVPHISSGSARSFQFIVKNHTASIDVRYKEIDGTALDVLDSNSESAELPSIRIGGIQQRLTFNNIVNCPTPNGTRLNTIVDICLDHNKGVGNECIMALEAETSDVAISHVVTSNVTHLTTLHCLGPVTHVDPQHSSQKYMLSSPGHLIDSTKQFGNTAIKIYETSPTQCLLLSEAREAQTQAYAAVVLYYVQLEKELKEACDILVEEFGAIDSEATNLRERSSNLVAADIAVDEKIGYIKGNLEQVRAFAQQQYDSIKEKMRHCKTLSADKAQEAAELLSKCDATVESSSDTNEKVRIISHQIQIISFFLSNTPGVETTIHQAEPASGLTDPLADAPRRRFVKLHMETSRSKKENAEYDVLLGRFSAEIIEHPERFITLAGGEAAEAGASPANMVRPKPDEHGDDEQKDETTLNPHGVS